MVDYQMKMGCYALISFLPPRLSYTAQMHLYYCFHSVINLYFHYPLRRGPCKPRLVNTGRAILSIHLHVRLQMMREEDDWVNIITITYYFNEFLKTETKRKKNDFYYCTARTSFKILNSLYQSFNSFII